MKSLVPSIVKQMAKKLEHADFRYQCVIEEDGHGFDYRITALYVAEEDAVDVTKLLNETLLFLAQKKVSFFCLTLTRESSARYVLTVQMKAIAFAWYPESLRANKKVPISKII